MNKKNLMVVIGASIALALLIGAIILIVTQESATDESQEPYRFEESEHMGVAQLLSKADVERAIEGIGTDVQGPEASGTLYLDNVRSETSTFTFMADGQQVRVDLDVKIHPEGSEDSEALSHAFVFRATEGETIEGVGDEARMYFPADHITTGERQYSLIAIEGLAVTVINLTMPAGSEVALSRVAGEHILQELGRQVDISNLD